MLEKIKRFFKDHPFSFAHKKENYYLCEDGDKSEAEIYVAIRRYKRCWRYDGEKNDPPLAFSLPDKPDDRFLLVEDEAPDEWSVHFCTTDKDSLTEDEKELLIGEIASHIAQGHKLSSHGFITPGGEKGLRRFLNHGFVETSETRTLKSKLTGEDVVIPVLIKK